TELTQAKRGIIVAGPQFDPALAEPVARLANVLGFPLLADPLSLVRCGPHPRDAVIDSCDAFLRDGRVCDQLRPDLVLRFGAMPTSKPVLLYLQRFPEAEHIVVGSGWEDPTLLAARVIDADPARACRALLQRVEPSAGCDWLETWRAINRATRAAIAEQIDTFDEPFEGRVFAELAELLPDGATLWASSSVPVRDLDTFFPTSTRAIHFLANRGANGIDGVISSALGASTVSSGPLVLAIGDIAFYHDMNGLLAAKLHRLNATIVLLNNDGGGIFSFLPQAQHPEHFEALFGTPHGLVFRPVAEMYGASYRLTDGIDDFRGAVVAALQEPGLKIIEVRTDRVRNVELHDEVWRAIAVALTGEVLR
ncbi:MAG TPA: thiamine pyrophosphate-dependent enzyme, partial [Nitrolancea sp.]|nr:thiamine pyrophosphate-dependent enzyme [Nitrolancea sp.]